MILNLRFDFPILDRQVNGHPLIYLDSAATSQKPQAVLTALLDYYTHHNANVHRGIHTVGDESTQAFTAARATIAAFIGAKSSEIIFVRNTTEAINFVAQSSLMASCDTGDEIIVTELEHHSNLLPWQRLARQKNLHLLHLPVRTDGELALDQLRSLITAKTKILAITAVSNVLGTRVNIKSIAESIKKKASRAKNCR